MNCQESSREPDAKLTPYVVTYFEVEEGTPWVYLVAENIGATPAKYIGFIFSPELRTKDSTPFEGEAFSHGIPFLPPGQRIISFFESMLTLFQSDLPLRYAVKCTFRDMQETTSYQLGYELDLSIFRGLHYLDRKGTNEQVRELSSIARELGSGNRSSQKFADALWRLVGTAYAPDVPTFPTKKAWMDAVIAEMRFLKFFLRPPHEAAPQRYFYPAIELMQSALAAAEIQIVKLAAAAFPKSRAIIDSLLPIADLCSWLGHFEFFIDGGKSRDRYEELTADLTKRIDSLIADIEHRKTLVNKGEST